MGLIFQILSEIIYQSPKKIYLAALTLILWWKLYWGVCAWQNLMEDYLCG